jgi:DNA-binding beta-propeller fold protein YncE
MVAEIFAPDLISTEGSEINAAFSPDGNEFYYTAWEPETGTRMMVTRRADSRWTEPERVSVSTHPTDVDPAISPDGERLVFSSRRPRPGGSGETRDGFDMWFARRVPGGWGEAEYMGPVVNSGDSQVYATLTHDHTMYFQAVREEGFGKADIYRARLADGQHLPPENLGPVINSPNYEGDVFIAPDESYLIVTVYGREDDIGAGDLYISFRGPDDTWTPLQNMGEAVNTDAREFCPMVTPDGKYLFFTSKRRGDGDIFWIDAKIIETFRQ